MSTIRAGNTLTTALTTVTDLTGELSLEAASGIINTANNTGGFIIPTGTSAQRPSTPTAGMLRFNTTTGALEGYAATGWTILGGGPPTILSATPAFYNGEQGSIFVITGTNFTADLTVKILDSSNVEYAATYTYQSSSQITITTPQDFTVAQEPLKIKISQISGTVISAGLIDCGNTPAWTTASGTLLIIYETARSGISTTVNAIDTDSGSTISYSIDSGSLPGGLSLNSSTGAITGNVTNGVSTDTTYNFTVRATDNAGNASDRAFNIIVKAPVLSVYSYTGGDQSFTVPSGVTKLTFKLWGAGGSGTSAGGGSGGFTQSTLTVSPTQVYTLIVGGGSYSRNGGVNYGGGQRSNYDGGNAGGDGGGRSAVRLSIGTEILTAGGGGGGGYVAGGGGGSGGGLTGANAGGTYGGGGGSQTGGGAGKCGQQCSGAGSQFQGGGTSGGWTGGGGGGGWYGGGGGAGVDSSHDGGGGGSGWVGRNGSSILSGDNYGSSGFEDTSGRTDTVSGVVYTNTRCLRGNNSQDIHWANNAGNGGSSSTWGHGRIVVYY